MIWRPLALLTALTAASFCSCSTKQYELNLAEYPVLPAARATHLTRAVLNSNERMRSFALWGNYGGPGSNGGEPIDQMDQYFLEHDMAYLQGITREELWESDQLLVSQLEALDPDDLSPAAADYRDLAIRYFHLPLSRVIGKPPDVLLGIKNRPTVIDISDRSVSSK